MTGTEDDLKEDLRELYWRWKEEYKYNANRFIQKLDRGGAIKTASDLALEPGSSQGFKELQSRGLLHLTVEAIVLRLEFTALFPPAVIDAARRKLHAAGAKFIGQIEES